MADIHHTPASQAEPNSAPLFNPAQRLAELNRYVEMARARANSVADASQANPHPVAIGALSVPTRSEPAELASVARFRETWARVAAEKQVDQALGRAPDNPGPLNSHRLVLHTLTLMRNLSPEYLRRFMSHVDTLQWLEQASNQVNAPTGRAVTAKGAAVRAASAKIKASQPRRVSKPSPPAIRQSQNQ